MAVACLSLYMPSFRNLRAEGEMFDCCANLMVRYNLKIKEIPLHYSVKKVAKAEAADQNRLVHRLRVCEFFATFVSFLSLQSVFCCNSSAQTKAWLCKPFQAPPGRNGGKSWLQIPDDCTKGCRPEQGACSGTFDVTWCTCGIVYCSCAWNPSSWQVLIPLVSEQVVAPTFIGRDIERDKDLDEAAIQVGLISTAPLCLSIDCLLYPRRRYRGRRCD
jgi:hypothetical protein